MKIHLPLQGATTPAYVRTTTAKNTEAAATNNNTLNKKVNSALVTLELMYLRAAKAIIRANTPENQYN